LVPNSSARAAGTLIPVANLPLKYALLHLWCVAEKLNAAVAAAPEAICGWLPFPQA
jgi:hypothetical protein